jgi:hypothetical protein
MEAIEGLTAQDFIANAAAEYRRFQKTGRDEKRAMAAIRLADCFTRTSKLVYETSKEILKVHPKEFTF